MISGELNLNLDDVKKILEEKFEIEITSLRVYNEKGNEVASSFTKTLDGVGGFVDPLRSCVVEIEFGK